MWLVLYLGAALQLGQRLNQGFLLLKGRKLLLDSLLHLTQHRSHELVLLRSGGGPDPLPHGLVELVHLGAALQSGQRLYQDLHTPRHGVPLRHDDLVLPCAGDGDGESPHHRIAELVPGLLAAALQSGQRLNQGFRFTTLVN